MAAMMASDGGPGQEEATEGEKHSREVLAAETADPLGMHRWVRLTGLSTTGLNGKLAEVVKPLNAEGRVDVRVVGEGRKNIKPENLTPVSDLETSKVCRLAAHGEDHTRCKRSIRILSTRWPNEVLAASRFVESPISSLLGFPLRITRVQPRSKLTKPEHFDNQWATWMMVNVVSGIAPPKWDSMIGSVVVWRPDGGAVSADDMCLFNDYLCGILDRYASGTVDPGQDFTPAKWQVEKNDILRVRRLSVDDDPQQHDGINI